MAQGFSRRRDRYVARLDEQERAVVAGLMSQVLDLIDAGGPPAPSPGDAFEEIVSGLGGLGGFGSLSGARGEGDATDGADGADQDLEVPDSPEALGGRGAGSEGPRDPALDRLFPSGNREDEQAAAEFRRLTEQGLRDRKAENLKVAIEALESVGRDRIELTRAEATAMVVAMTDVRLVLGERLGLRTDEDATRVEELLEALDPDDPMVYALAVYDFLTWLQETLSQALLP